LLVTNSKSTNFEEWSSLQWDTEGYLQTLENESSLLVCFTKCAIEQWNGSI